MQCKQEVWILLWPCAPLLSYHPCKITCFSWQLVFVHCILSARQSCRGTESCLLSSQCQDEGISQTSPDFLVLIFNKAVNPGWFIKCPFVADGIGRPNSNLQVNRSHHPICRDGRNMRGWNWVHTSNAFLRFLIIVFPRKWPSNEKSPRFRFRRTQQSYQVKKVPWYLNDYPIIIGQIPIVHG